MSTRRGIAPAFFIDYNKRKCCRYDEGYGIFAALWILHRLTEHKPLV